jgi:diguanylate cyclase (GGDEF)-like protein/putative nucleotidyltransferase with HDIG domain
LNDDPQLKDFLRATRLTFILWVVMGTARLVWAIFHIQRGGSPIEALGVLLAVMVAASVWYYCHRLSLRSLQSLKNYSVEMTDLFNSTLSTLASAIDAKDIQRTGHTQRVQKYARAIAEAMNLDENQIRGIAAAALLHDIGKLAIPEYILNKRGTLTREEMRKMRMHPELGADIIANIHFPFPVANSILAHHERFDGAGYPKGLTAKEIPLAARILAVADSFDAYVFDRTETSETLKGAMRALRESSGTAFDPEVVMVWESIYPQVVVLPTGLRTPSRGPIEQATSELKLLESLAHALEGLTSVPEIFLAARAVVTKSIPGCMVVIERGKRDGIAVEFAKQVIATIRVDRPGVALNDDELRFLHAVAAKIAPALSNGMTIEAARREATIDKLTGLANRRAFEMISASLERQHCSVVLIDVNCFKAVNDNFGHATGDTTLSRIATHLRAAFHDAEFHCRLGGDEFLVLSFAGVRALRGQIRRFRRMIAWDPAHETFGSLFGVSCGLASIPLDAKNIEQAVECADERMYAFKSRFKRFAGRVLEPTGL